MHKGFFEFSQVEQDRTHVVVEIRALRKQLLGLIKLVDGFLVFPGAVQVDRKHHSYLAIVGPESDGPVEIAPHGPFGPFGFSRLCPESELHHRFQGSGVIREGSQGVVDIPAERPRFALNQMFDFPGEVSAFNQTFVVVGCYPVVERSVGIVELAAD